MISKVERGKKNPTLVSQHGWPRGFVTLSWLAGEEERRLVVVVPREGRAIMRGPETGFERQLLSPGFGGGVYGVEFIRNVIPPGSTSGESPPHHRGVEEYIAVEKGMLSATLGGERGLSREGDVLYFETDVPHRFDNPGEK